ncbi:MAG: hypothetical protein AABY01_04475, partial [Nanoarchaeota archaeon]
DSKYIVDLDLAILGAPQEEFDQYERDIRKEYASVPEEIYVPKRREILKQFHTRKPLFNTEAFQALEARAKENLARSIGKDNL